MLRPMFCFFTGSVIYCHCISQFGLVKKVLLPCVADKWHSVCENNHSLAFIFISNLNFLFGLVNYMVILLVK